MEDRTKILEVVIGSNQRLIQLHTVGKKEGAPRILLDEGQLFAGNACIGRVLTKIRSRVSG